MRISKVILLLQFLLLFSCKESVILDEDDFTDLLVKIHMTDAMLNNADVEGDRNLREDECYSYYSDIFDEYGINKAQFDSCLSYYSRNTEEFLLIYNKVIRILNKKLTAVNKEMAYLKANDTVNLLEVPDMISVDICNTVQLFDFKDVIPGHYHFAMKFKFDSLCRKSNPWIESYFIKDRYVDTVYKVDSIWYSISFDFLDSTLFADAEEISGKGYLNPEVVAVDSVWSYVRKRDSFEVTERICFSDTLRVRDLAMYADTTLRFYTWDQYIDSSFSRLVVCFVEQGDVANCVRTGCVMNMRLNRIYESEHDKNRLRLMFLKKYRQDFYQGRSPRVLSRTSLKIGSGK